MDQTLDQLCYGLPEELLLALAFLRVSLSDEECEPVESLTSREMDWKAFGKWIERHKLGPLIYAGVRDQDSAAVPDSVRFLLRECYRKNGLRCLALVAENERVLKLLEENNIHVLPFKGVALAIQVYGDPFRRHAGDLDMLVAPDSADTAAQLLAEHGYVAEGASFGRTPRQNANIKKYRNHYVFYNPKNLIRVEVHWRFHTSRFLCPMDFEVLFNNSLPLNIGRWHGSTLGIEDTLLFLVTHGAIHAWNHLFWLYDVALILKHTRSLDWCRIFKRFADLGMARPLSLGLFLSHVLLRSPLSDEVLAAAERDPMLRFLVRGSIRAIVQEAPFVLSSADKVRDLWYQTKLSGDLMYKMDHVCSRLLDVEGWKSWPLPDALFPVYYIIGPLTWLTRKYGKDRG